MSHKKLTPKQEKFCQEYVVDLNSARAAVRAGYSPKNADVTGPRLLVNVGIKARLKELQQEVQKRTEITQDAVIKELALLAFGRITDLTRTNGDGHLVLDFRDATPDQKAIVTGVKTKSRREKDGEEWLDVVETEVKVADKVKSLELLGKHLGLFVDKLEMSGPGGGPISTVDLAKLTEDDLAVLQRAAEIQHGSISSSSP